MPRLVRRQPLFDRIKAALDPYDIYLWLAEELHESSWDESLKEWTLPIGAAVNLLLIITRANSGGNDSPGSSDVFGDFEGSNGSGWFRWLSAFISHLLVGVAVLNAAYAFFSTRKYRLFERPIEESLATSSARRVNINSSPGSGSPFSYLSSLVTSPTARSRAHPDQKTDVWEISVWNPKDFHLELFTIFSPGHVLIYWLFLPTTSSDPRPSVTVVTSILLSALLSLQLVMLRTSFIQQAKDLRIVNTEVMNEYDTKFVHPNLNKPVRDVGIQTSITTGPTDIPVREVDVYTPTVIINRGFRTNPNPNYASHLSDDSFGDIDSPLNGRLPRSTTAPNLHTPNTGLEKLRGMPSPLGKAPILTTPSRPSMTHRSTSPTRGDGGSLGVFTHSESPLRKSTSTSRLLQGSRLDAGTSAVRRGSPLKRTTATSDEAPSPRLGSRGDGAQHRLSSFR